MRNLYILLIKFLRLSIILIIKNNILKSNNFDYNKLCSNNLIAGILWLYLLSIARQAPI